MPDSILDDNGFDCDDEDEHGPSAAQINADLLDAMASDNGRIVQRVLEQHANIWLDSPFSSDAQFHVQPILFAMAQEWPCEDALNAMDEWLGGIRSWHFDGLLPIHVAVAHKNEWALRWCLRKDGSILDLEAASESNDDPRSFRSALGLAAQMGDVEWLTTVLNAVEEASCDQDRRLPRSMHLLRLQDQAQDGPAMLLALLAMAAQALGKATGVPTREGDWDGCARLLAQRGFSPDSTSRHGVLAGIMIAALSRNPLHTAHAACLRPIAELAFELGAPRRAAWLSQCTLLGHQRDDATDFVDIGLFGIAGACLEPRWRHNLLACGFEDNAQHGSWCSGVSERVLADHRNAINTFASHEARALLGEWDVAERAWTTPIEQRPFKGMERKFFDLFSTASQDPARDALFTTGTELFAQLEQLLLRMETQTFPRKTGGNNVPLAGTTGQPPMAREPYRGPRRL